MKKVFLETKIDLLQAALLFCLIEKCHIYPQCEAVELLRCFFDRVVINGHISTNPISK